MKKIKLTSNTSKRKKRNIKLLNFIEEDSEINYNFINNDKKEKFSYEKLKEDIDKKCNKSKKSLKIKDEKIEGTSKNDNLKNIFDLSNKTKNILKNIYNNKNNSKDNFIKNESKTILDNKNKVKYCFTNEFNIKNINNTEIPKLSTKTLDIINKLKKEKLNNIKIPEQINENITKDDNSCFSFRYKYEELIHKPRDLPLPINYKKLISSFSSLEQNISLNKIRNSKTINTFDNIRKNIEIISNHNFDIIILKKILYIVPFFYILKYSEKPYNETYNKNDNLYKYYDLVIDIPTNFKELEKKNYPDNFDFLSINFFDQKKLQEFYPLDRCLTKKEMDERSKIFKNILLHIINKYHTDFLTKNKIKIEFDPLSSKTWYHDFDVNKECKDIPLFEIPLPPNNDNIFAKTIQEIDIKNSIESTLDIDILEDEFSIQNIDTCMKPINKYVSNQFIQKIKKKEIVNKITNEIYNFNNYKNSCDEIIDDFIEILNNIKILLLSKKQSMKLEDIVYSLLKENTKLYSKELMIKIIYYLSDKFNNFITVKNHSILGKIVVLKINDYIIPNRNDIKKILFENAN